MVITAFTLYFNVRGREDVDPIKELLIEAILNIQITVMELRGVFAPFDTHFSYI